MQINMAIHEIICRIMGGVLIQNIFSFISGSGKIATTALVLLGGTCFAEEYAVQRGSRPEIPIERISADNCRPDIVRIKLSREALRNTRSFKTRQGVVRTGNPSLDELNKIFEVNSYSATFGNLKSKSRASSRQAKRHEAWGFDQWYDVKLNARSVREAVAAFGALGEVEICEPVYLKVRTDTPASDTPASDTPASDTPAPDSSSNDWIPNDPDFSDQWHYENTGQSDGKIGADISLQEAWKIERGFEEILVAVLDGGIQQDHPDLKANLWSEGGYNFIDDSPVITGGSHGTHVAGTVAAVNNNGIGVSGVAGGSGTGDGVRLMSCQIFNATSNGGSHLALVWAADNGAVISQNSWSYGDSLVFNQVDLDAIDYFNANGGGDALDQSVAFFSAGNRGLEGTYYPGFYEGTFSVAASDHNDEPAVYSNFGTWVDITAPGGDRGVTGILSTTTGGKYKYKDGTSMATPHVSGVAALIVSAAYRNGVVLTATQLKEILQNSCDDIFSADIKNKMGAGRLNAGKALNYLKNNYLTDLIPPLELSAETIDAESISLKWTKNGEMDVLLVASKDKVFGTPQNGTTYAAGDEIDGGGTVVYIGSDTAAIHSDLQPGDSLSYRIYSQDGDSFSGYRTTYAVTDHFLEAGTAEDPIILENLDELQIISSFPRYWDKCMALSRSVAAGSTREWNNGAGWSPIGNSQFPFSGTFNGCGNSIDSLYIKKSSEHSSFFGLVEGGTIDSLGITNIYINAKAYSAGIVGRLNPGTLSNSFSTGEISGALFTGGIAGLLKEATVNNCYARVIINGGQYVGGFSGSCFGTEINNCYSTSPVTGESSTGGFIGAGAAGVTNYWDTENAGTTASKGGTGKGTVEMKNEQTFSGWDFDSVWSISENEYPSLQWEENSIEPVAISPVKQVTSTDKFFAIVPNPIERSANEVSLFVPASFKGTGTITILDALGNKIDKQAINVSSSASIFSWDLRNKAGKKVSSGSYVAKITVKDHNGTIRSAKALIGIRQ